MPSPFHLLTVCALAFFTLSTAAPIDVSQAVARPSLNKRGGRGGGHHRGTTKKYTTKKTTTKKTTTKKAATTTSSSSSKYSGTATWFKPATEGGSTGACGDSENNNSLIVALNADQYGDMNSVSSWCGKKISITGPAGTASAIVNDACPECSHGDLDLTPALFEKIVGDMDIGVGDITWKLE